MHIIYFATDCKEKLWTEWTKILLSQNWPVGGTAGPANICRVKGHASSRWLTPSRWLVSQMMIRNSDSGGFWQLKWPDFSALKHLWPSLTIYDAFDRWPKPAGTGVCPIPSAIEASSRRSSRILPTTSLAVPPRRLTGRWSPSPLGHRWVMTFMAMGFHGGMTFMLNGWLRYEI
jgi:hypothetical protein